MESILYLLSFLLLIMGNENIKELNPEERLAKLKKLKEEKEKEIAEAKKLISDAEEEINIEQEFKEKVPIPQVAVDNIQNLSESEKLVVMTHRNISVKKGSNEDDSEDSKEGNDKSNKAKVSLGDKKSSSSGLENKTNYYGGSDSLEATVGSEHINPELMQGNYQTNPGGYVQELSQVPMTQLYDEVSGIYKTGVEKGYFSEEESRSIRYINEAIDQKMEDVKQGSYSLTEEVAKVAILSKELAEKVSVLYKSGANIYDPNRKDND